MQYVDDAQTKAVVDKNNEKQQEFVIRKLGKVKEDIKMSKRTNCCS